MTEKWPTPAEVIRQTRMDIQGQKVALDRDEHEPCEKGTVGCCIRHGNDDTECATW